jgi:hypothetical protein
VSRWERSENRLVPGHSMHTRGIVVDFALAGIVGICGRNVS